jgi:UDP-N-acetylmuramate dehydrogenase
VSRIEDLLGLLRGTGWGRRARRDAPLASYTTYHVGGPADLLVQARTPDELATSLRLARQAGVPALVLGSGSNVLIADAGVRGLVVLNRCRRFEIDDDGLLVSESGADLRQLARASVQEGWAGLEWAIGVPGTVGGAVVGNAGAYGGTIADNLVWADLALADGDRALWGPAQLALGYRTSALKRIEDRERRPVVLQVAFQLKGGDRAVLIDRARAIQAQRRVRTPAGRCAGSVFKRTLHYPAGFLIEQAGLKGRRVGDAVVSEKHANFIMNRGKATAADIRALIDIVRGEVLEKLGETLEPEIEFVGDWDAKHPDAADAGEWME